MYRYQSFEDHLQKYSKIGNALSVDVIPVNRCYRWMDFDEYISHINLLLIPVIFIKIHERKFCYCALAENVYEKWQFNETQ